MGPHDEISALFQLPHLDGRKEATERDEESRISRKRIKRDNIGKAKESSIR